MAYLRPYDEYATDRSLRRRRTDISDLEAVGLTAAECAVYEMLVERPAVSLADLLESWPPHVTASPRTVLATLESKGLVTKWSVSPVRYTAVAPNVAIDVLIRARDEQLRRAQFLMDDLTQRWRQVDRALDPREMVEVITGRTATLQRAEQIQRTSVTEVLIFDKPPYASPHRGNLTEIELLRDQRTSYRCLYDRSGLEVPDKYRTIEKEVAAGEQARLVPSLPLKMVMGDRRIALIPLRTEPSVVEVAIVIHPSALLDALHALFENLWEQATPLVFDDIMPERAGLDATEQRIMRLLVTGLTDKAIGRQLDLGERTVQRRVREIMRFFGVSNRLQLGIRLERDGRV